jgi:hypothetical protein
MFVENDFHSRFDSALIAIGPSSQFGNMLPVRIATRCHYCHCHLVSGLLALLCCNVATSTSILAYTDPQCTSNVHSLNSNNGYPNGTCTSLRSRNSTTISFQVAQPDPGCRGKRNLRESIQIDYKTPLFVISVRIAESI